MPLSVDMPDKDIVLVVDDNPESLGMVSQALEQQGMTVLVARDGLSAIKLTGRVNPDVILMDAVMPGTDGFETCRLLKFGPNPTLAPIIFMTGLSDHEHVVKGLEAGGVDYITKPVVVEEMIARLTTHLVNSRMLQSARQALDTFDRMVLAFNSAADLVWGSDNAMSALDAVAFDVSEPEFRQWIASCMTTPISSVQPFQIDDATFQFVGFSGAQELLVKLILQRGESKEDILSDAFGLTSREAEILFWLTQGKTNRDISTILNLSARTVNKHLEQVFQKMGVDNRTSAAVLADRLLTSKR